MTGLTLVLLALGQSSAPPELLGGYEIKVRAAGQKDFAAAGQVGVEFFADPPAKAVLAVSDKGQLAVVPAPEKPGDRKVGWLFAHDLKTRGPAEEVFSASTKAFGVEAFKDSLTGKLLVVTQAGGVSLADYPPAVLADRDAKYHHNLTLSVRGPTEEDLKTARKKVGVEVYLDGNTGRLVYVTDAGAVAVAPAPADLKANGAQKPLYGSPVRVRGAEDKEYKDATPRIGVEVYQDTASGHLVYVTEAGGIAVVPAPADLTSGKGFREERGLRLAVRPGGETDPLKTVKLGVEVLADNNSGATVYVTAAGSVAVLPKK